MEQQLKRMRLAVWLLFAFVFAATVALLLCWFLIVPADDAENIRNFKMYLVAVLALAGYVAIQTLLGASYFITKLQAASHTSDRKASEAIGNDVAETYAFGKIGMIVLDKNDILNRRDPTILWVSPFLASVGMNLVDLPASSLSPKISELIDSDSPATEVEFRYQNKDYSAKFLRDANLLILKDVTDLTLVQKREDDGKTCIGYIDVNFYSDINTSDEQMKADVDATIRKLVIDYFSRYKCLVKSLRPDSFILICTKENLRLMETDRFSILKSFATTFKNNDGEDNPLKDLGLTLSIGIGLGDRAFAENDELARQALDYVIVRGGNQAVVARFGESMMAYGGQTSENMIATSNTKIKIFARQFATTVSKASNVLIVPHRNADMDAIASALGVYAICMSLPHRYDGFKVNIVYDSQNVNNQTDAAARQLLPSTEPNFFKNVFVSFSQADDMKGDNTLIVAVDHNRPAQSIYPELYRGSENTIAIIDHHVKEADSFKDTAFEHVDASSSSTCELVTLYCLSYPFTINVPDYIATLMLSGILLDTQNFLVHTRNSTYEAVIALNQMGADDRMAKEFLKQDFETFEIKSRILANLDSYSHDILIAKAPETELVNGPILAISANELTRVEGVRAAFALGYTAEKQVYISARGNGMINLPMIMNHLNHGGGHFSQAATLMTNITLDQAEIELKHVLDEYLADASDASALKNGEKGE